MNEQTANIANALANQQPSLMQLAPALVKAWGEIGAGVAKDSDNPAFHSGYASLGAVMTLVKPHLAANGLALIQSAGELEGDKLTVVTLLLHTSGEHISFRSQSPIGKTTAQAVGSVITYLRRYVVMAICGLAPVDDDGNEASQAAPPKKTKAANDEVDTVLATIAAFTGTADAFEKAVRPAVEALGEEKVNKAYVQKRRELKGK